MGPFECLEDCSWSPWRVMQVDGFRSRRDLGGRSCSIDFADGDRLQIKPLSFPGLVYCMAIYFHAMQVPLTVVTAVPHEAHTRRSLCASKCLPLTGPFTPRAHGSYGTFANHATSSLMVGLSLLHPVTRSRLCSRKNTLLKKT